MWYKRENNTVIIAIYVQPGARRTEIVGCYGDELKIRLDSPPADGRANNALLDLVAQLFDVPRFNVELIRGSKSRHKKVLITDSKIEPLSIITYDK